MCDLGALGLVVVVLCVVGSRVIVLELRDCGFGCLCGVLRCLFGYLIFGCVAGVVGVLVAFRISGVFGFGCWVVRFFGLVFG